MKSKKVQLIVLGVAVIALVAMVLRSTRQGSSATDEAARLVRGADLDEDSQIEDTTIVERERPAQGSTQSANRLDGTEAATNEAPSESTDEDKAERKIKKGQRSRPKRSGGRKVASDSDRGDTPAAEPKGPKVQISGKRIKKDGP